MQGERVSDIDEVLAELKRERQKNAELLDIISALEAQIQNERAKGSTANLMNDNHGQGDCANRRDERSSKKLKTQQKESATEEPQSVKIRKNSEQSASETQHDANFRPTNTPKLENGLVNWISTNDAQFLPLEKSKDVESILDSEDTEDSDDEDGPYPDVDAEVCTVSEDNQGGIGESIHINAVERIQDNQSEIDVPIMSPTKGHDMGKAEKNAGFRNMSSQKKPSKVAFCPKEVKGILELEVLALKNAHSHTIRKIIVFASLGIRHGCDDMYELDYHHFSILRKGEPYVSPDDPGEHVLYQNPGVKRKMFYPNRRNTALCPIQILEDEKAMRPSDASCPSCLFLCIKYGGKTRNIPQKEYVRQRMGRNKLKSFGPLICQMAKLVNIRTGSFFFKALGITLLFMAGFSDDIVQRETRYRSLDLLQKYFRTDEDAAGEELFHANSSASELVSLALQKPTSKALTKSKGRRQMSSTCIENLQRPTQETPATSPAPPMQFGLVGHTSAQNPPQAGFQTMPCQALIDFTTLSRPLSNSTVINSQPNASYNHHSSYPVFPPQPASPMMPLIYWPSPHNAYPCLYPSSHSYQPLSALNGGQYISFRPQPYYSQGFLPCPSVSIPRPVDSMKRDNVHLDEAAISDSESSSSTRPN